MIAAYITILSVMVLGDLIWIRLVAQPQYKQHLGELLCEQPRKLAGSLFYLAYPAALVYFAVWPGVSSANMVLTCGNAVAVGALGYATFSLTNWAILKPWTASLVITDVLWGAFITAVSSAAGYWVAV